MKRLVFAFLLTAALLGLLAAPALAGPPSADSFYLSPNTAYIFAYGDGSWFEIVGEGNAGVPVLHWVSYDDEGNLLAPADPIPANYDVVMQVSWKNISYGLVETLPLTYQVKVRIPEAGVDLSYEQAKAHWTGAFLWDDFWVTNAGEVLPFNSHIGAQVYANRWLPSLTGDKGLATNLTAGKKLPAGTYTVYYAENLLRTYTAMDLWFEGQKSPVILKPEGENVVPPYTFTIAGP
jgi:hypothetical protein